MKLIPLNKGQETQVDDSDYAWLSAFTWWVMHGSHHSYAGRQYSSDGKVHTLSMHRAITQAPPGFVVDHINGDTLDNRRDNLRVCTHCENLSNQKRRSGARYQYRGVRPTRSGKWKATVNFAGQAHYLGVFDSEKAAAFAYDQKAVELKGAFARPNLAQFIRAAQRLGEAE